MTHTYSIGTISGSDLRLHWSWFGLPLAVACYSFAMFSWPTAAMFVLLLLAVYLGVLAHQGIQLLAARRFGVWTRDVTLYPFWGVARLMRLSERPWQEIRIAATGPVMLAFLAACIGALLALGDRELTFLSGAIDPTTESFLLHLFWAAVFLTAFHLLPFLPLDGGRVLRAYLAMRMSRLPATETAAILSTFGAGLLLIVAVAWLKSPLVGLTGVLLYFGAQQDLGTTRFFSGLRHAGDDPARKPTMMVPLDQIVTPECRPNEPDYNGFTWNEEARLWIEWRDGQPVGANALIGDGRP